MKIISTSTMLWILLAGATILSFVLVEDTDYIRVATTAAVLLGAIKVRLIFIYFMELKWHFRLERILFELWTASIVIMILGGYWLGVLRPT